MEALDVYRQEPRTFLGIGALALPIGAVFNVLLVLATGVPPLVWVRQFFNDSNADTFTMTLLVIVFQELAMVLLIAPAIAFALKELRAGIKPGVWSSYLGGFHRLRWLVISLAIVAIIVLALAWTVFLLPVAVYPLIRLQFFSPAIIHDDMHGIVAPLTQSRRITRGRWVRALVVTLAFQVLGALPGPVIGVLLLVVGGATVRFSNAVSSVLYAIFVPLAVIGITLAYHRLKGEPVIEPYISTRERDPVKQARQRALIDEALRRASQPPHG